MDVVHDMMLPRAMRSDGSERARRTISSTQQSYEVAKSRIEKEKADRAQWSKARAVASQIVSSTPFSLSMSILVCLNMVFVIMEVNYSAKDMDIPKWFASANISILALYFLEVCAKIFVFRMRFFTDLPGMLDFCVVLMDITLSMVIALMPMSLAPLVFARLARIFKMTRALRMLSVFPELNVLMKGLLFASRTIAWGVVLLLLCLCFWGIFATLFIHPIVQDLQRDGYWESLGCERCPRAFESVEMSMLTFCQQLIVGEGWSEINTPLMERHPPTAIFFILVMVSLMLAALNLLLGVMVERASEANAASVKELLSKKNKAREDASIQLLKMCEQLDEDRSGKLTFDELQRGIEENPEFANVMALMDLDERDLGVVFSMLDSDGSGDVQYQEFVEQLQMMKSGETHTLLVFIKFYIMEMRASLNKVLPAMRTSHVGDVRQRLSGRRQASRAAFHTAPTPGAVPPVFAAREAGEAADAMPCFSGPKQASQAAFGCAPTSGEVSPSSMLDAELQRLTEIRKEVMMFSQVQVERIDAVHRCLSASLREAPSPTAMPGTPPSNASKRRADDYTEGRTSVVGAQSVGGIEEGEPACSL
eukprot:CAMPEP_0176105668 /NCGR_PEP_ID=MMETSP0120_2-20121206/53026_1 /TAXON_ID=160619 /ORGANISM="Kryptoperidinium foliaceum, Strain CCMP 1326" /LENGTH=592 /DNA_ID=CAMNT_0017439785 /DNA_START=61 /DNA_END=1839 /DNA_ORIENTATION=+